MKQMRNFLSVIALALVGSVMTGCSSEDNLAGNQQPAVKDNIVTVTTTIGLGGGDATTRALSATGVKTFEVGDQIALFYEKSGSSDQFKAVATASNISANGKSATFTFELDNPESDSDISLCYPADFMDEVPNELNPAFAQDGTLNGGVKANDLGFAAGKLVGTDLPASITLTNQFAVVAFTLKDGKGTDAKGDDEEITSTITEMTINLPDHEDQTYTITREAADGPIYIVLPPISEGETINITATGGGKTYTKTLDNKDYDASNFYQQGLLMTKQAAVPTGALSGQFSVASGKKVYFSKGNLQYIGSANTPYWKFAEHQYDYITTSQNSDATNVDRDLFGWGTSGSAPSGYTARAPYYITHTPSNYVSNITTSGTSWGTNSEWDWGHNAISNGGNTADTWRTLTKDEWVYLFQTRIGAGNKYGFATVAGKAGIIIVPDDFTDPMKNNGSGAFVGSTTTGWTANVYIAENWSAMESAGCVFLPAAGGRFVTSMEYVGSNGCYWSSTPNGAGNAYGLGFGPSGANPGRDFYRSYGSSVRLVCPVQ